MLRITLDLACNTHILPTSDDNVHTEESAVLEMATVNTVLDLTKIFFVLLTKDCVRLFAWGIVSLTL